jgi:predicted AlkP superfamily phosphohydrolase/phosphomutase
MLSNSVVAASLATAYVLVLVLELNPTLPLARQHVLPLIATVGLYYVVHLTVICYMLLVLRQIFARELFSPAWISVGVLVWLGAFAAAVGSGLMLRNLTTFALVLDAASVTALARSALALAVAAALFLLVAALRRSFPDARSAWAPLLGIVMAASVAVPLAFRGSGVPPMVDARPIDAAPEVVPSERTSQVTVIAIDGGSLDFITSATAEGRLPNFGKMLDGGAVRHLATLHPTSAEAVWAAVVTGKLPQKNGVHSAGLYRLAHGRSAESTPLQLLPEYCFAHGLVRLGFLVEEPHTSATFRTRTLWSILSTHGISVGIVGWPLTQPAPVVRGFLVADTYHRAAQTLSGLANPSAVYPPELHESAVAAMESPTADDASTVPAAIERDQREESPARVDRMYERITDALSLTRPAQVTALRYQGLDPIGHYYLRFAVPADFGDVTDDERRRLGGVLERHYTIVDQAIGRAMAAIGPDDLLLVVSAYGMVPLNVGRRLVERLIGDPDLSGTHDAAPDGFLMAYGAPVARGRLQARASVVDVLPTLLYFLGLPIGRDMDGYVRTDLFKPAFTLDRPITYIPTYDR